MSEFTYARDVFKIGDRVKIIWKYGPYAGRVGTVTDIDDRGDVVVDNGDLGKWGMASSFELVERPEPKNVPMAELSHAERKQRPLLTGLLDYFPDACYEVAYCSFIGNEQHNPGEPMHWAKEKSIGQGDEIVRHLVDRKKHTRDSDGVRVLAKAAWRALELLQREIEAERTEALQSVIETERLAAGRNRGNAAPKEEFRY